MIKNNLLAFPANIKNIIFDFGGVILNIDPSKVKEAFIGTGIRNFDEVFVEASHSGLLNKFEKGTISSAEFRETIRNLSNTNITDKALDNAWNQMIGEFPGERIELIKNIRRNYHLFILSNTNSIHYDFYTKKFFNEFGFDLESLFDETYWSFKIGKSKPNTNTFEFVIQQSNLIPVQTLFIDDSLPNILAAGKVNLPSFYLKPGMDVCNLFENSFLKSHLTVNEVDINNK